MPNASTQTDIEGKLDTVVNLQYDDANSLYPTAMVDVFNERRQACFQQAIPELQQEFESLAESSSNYNGHYMAKLLLNRNSFKFPDQTK
jgi:hypothetical protein